MASEFDRRFSQQAAPRLLRDLGEAEVVYREPEANDVSLTAIVGNMEVVEEDGASSGGRRKRYTRYFIVSTDPDGGYGGVAEPRLSATIVHDGWEWSVKGIESQGNGLAKLIAERTTSVERARPGYRGK